MDYKLMIFKDTEHLGYAESIRSNIELILSNHDDNLGAITKEEGIEMLRNSLVLSHKLHKRLFDVAEHRNKLIKENEKLCF